MKLKFREIEEKDRKEIAELYCRVFAGKPWFESWTLEGALEVLDNAHKKESFLGVIAILENKIVGFSFGYRLPEKSTENVAFAKVRELFKSKEIESDNVFYGAETGVDPELQNKGIGTEMFDYRMKLVRSKGYSGVASRTINLAMVRVYEKVFGKKNVQEIFKDPVKSERTWYYVDLDKNEN